MLNRHLCKTMTDLITGTHTQTQYSTVNHLSEHIFTRSGRLKNAGVNPKLDNQL